MKKEYKIYMESVEELREVYDAPVIEMIEVVVERGFSESLRNGPNGSDDDWTN